MIRYLFCDTSSSLRSHSLSLLLLFSPFRALSCIPAPLNGACRDVATCMKREILLLACHIFHSSSRKSYSYAVCCFMSASCSACSAAKELKWREFHIFRLLLSHMLIYQQEKVAAQRSVLMSYV